ncbi:TonB-dependent receptor plug domain-containing protein [Sphingomonas lycopersici]|uniref:TonB-dependent receptor plug domain-containing protein n=1 Tax=Sphingomonas lycopersici TaxID=2951807 RepID=UPI002237F6E4|nr:TonB-dependent receptor [Sphingomonas lycopersici]
MRRTALGTASALALILGWAGAASAQTAPAQDELPAAKPQGSQSDAPEIVVTGTLLRGIAPVGTNVIGVSREDVTATGAQSSNDLLATIPQVSNFNTIPTGTAGFGQPIVQTNLRNLGASGGTTTLTLINGHRVVGQGILQTYVDPQIIPPGMIQRVEVIPDGGSSIYGSDAIGGVINFITRKRMNGIEANARYGFAAGYNTFDTNITAGKDWGSGSLMVSYAYAWHNNVQGYERDYVTQDFRAHGGADNRSFNCTPGNIQIGSTFYPLPGNTAGAPNRCSTNRYADIYPRENRHTVFATLDQQLSSSISTNITAYYSRRETSIMQATLAGSGTITSANPYFRPIGSETSQRVTFDFAPVFGNGIASPARFDSWGITPTFDADLGGGWHVRGLANYGHSYNETIEYQANAGNIASALAGTTTATALNPYNVAQTNAAVLTAIRDARNFSQAKQDLAEARLVADGRLLTLPGGDVKLAVGGEYHFEKIAANIAFGSAAAPFRNSATGSRNVASVFGEVFVPIFGEANGFVGVRALDLTGSVRYDHYDDVGGTTNPKIGFNYKPIDGVTIRGNWGTSFHAPSLADTVGAVDSRISFTTGVGYTAGAPLIWISGGSSTLKPETAHTWSLGADINPSFFPALTVSATYYNIDFTNIISVNAGGLVGGSTAWYGDPQNAPFFIRNPTIAQVNAFSGGLRPDNFPSLGFLYGNFGTPYAVLDLRRYNRGRLLQDGIDFNVRLNQATGFGSINASFGGTYTLHRRSSPSNNGIYIEQLDNGVSRFSFIAALGAEAGPVTGRVQLSHSGGYPIQFDATQNHVGNFDTVDLYFALDLEKLGVLKATSLTLNVDNLFDQNPPWRNATNGYANGSTLGRLFQFGIRTKF